MKNWKYLLLPAFAVVCPARTMFPQSLPDSSVLFLTGASCMEELSESQMEELESLFRHPLNINRSSKSKLEASGLFSAYQLHSLEEYRRASGDILSPAELSLLDGFSAECVDAISPFLDFSSNAPAGGSYFESGNSVDAQARLKWRKDGFQNRSKLRFEREGTLSAGVTSNKNFNLTLYGKGRLNGKLIFGDFSARFGQGLALWSGFSLSGLSSPSSFYRRPYGVTPSWTYSSAGMRGVAAGFELGRTEISALASLRRGSKVYALNSNRVFRNGSYGLTALYSEDGGILCSSDASVSIRKLLLFSESSVDMSNKSAAALLGARYSFDYQVGVFFLTRFYPMDYSSAYAGAARSSSKCSDERGISAAVQYKSKTFSVDWAHHPKKGKKQMKTVCVLPFNFSESFSLSFKLSDRYKPQDKYSHRVELRSDIKYEKGGWMALLRSDLVHMRDYAKLAYLELGYSWNWGYAYFRGTLYDVRNWDDRIYSYERDAPGNFNVPAYYGRGYALSVTGRVNIGKRNKLYFRVSEKELAFQYVFSY